MKSASSVRVVSRATNRNIGTSRKNERARSVSAAAIEWDVAIQPTIAGENAAAALPKVNAVPTAAPRIWVGNSSVLYPRPAPKLPVIRKFKTNPTQNRLDGSSRDPKTVRRIEAGRTKPGMTYGGQR